MLSVVEVICCSSARHPGRVFVMDMAMGRLTRGAAP